MKTAGVKKREPILIANRGEIAIRVARTAKKLGFPVVGIYSDSDRFSEHIRFCDMAINIGGQESKDSYLVIEKILAAAKQSGAKYVHPGFGFLSERASFVEACEKAGLVFIGPSADSMKIMGDKIVARRTVDSLKIPRVPGSPGAVKSVDEALKYAAEAGYPVLLKAAAGGGGKGMRRVDKPEELKSNFESASHEALSAFGDGSMYVEKYILEPHHVEVQVFGDGQGGAVHVGERECSIQRRHQKVWEESPAPILETHPKTRAEMFEAAIRASKHIQYAGAGTFEFIVDGSGRFYFLEMNTRLQVEHPVSEWVTGVDLVEWQILLAAGEFVLPTEEIQRRGSSVEVRIYAEDSQNFLPAPGAIASFKQPNGPFLRWDSAFSEKGDVNRVFDPMISKLSVWGRDRNEAIGRIRVALDECSFEAPKNLEGEKKGSMKTNLEFLRRLVRCQDTIDGNTTTDLIPRNPSLTADAPSDASESAAIALALLQLTASPELVGFNSAWADQAKAEGVRK